MLAFQQHVRSAIEDFQRVGFIILAAETKQHARLGLIHHELLQREVSRRQFDSGRPVLPTHAFPEGVVAIERDDFERAGLQIENHANQSGPDGSVSLGGVRNVPCLVRMSVIAVFDGIPSQHRGRTDDVNVRDFRRF